MKTKCNFCERTVEISEDLYKNIKKRGDIVLCKECDEIKKEKQKEFSKEENLEDVNVNEKYREFVGVGFNEETGQIDLMIMGKNPQLHAIAGLLDNAKKKIEFAWDQEEIKKIQMAQQKQKEAEAGERAQAVAKEMSKDTTQKHTNDSKIDPNEYGSKVAPAPKEPIKE